MTVQKDDFDPRTDEITATELPPIASDAYCTRPRGNRSGFKSLDKLGRDPRVELIEFEGHVSAGGDGIWLYTVSGFCNGDVGCHIVHEDTVAILKSAARRIRPCDCPECVEVSE